MKGDRTGGEAQQESSRDALYSREYFLTECEGYSQFLKTGGEELPPRLQKALDLAQLSANLRILDVGCGRGEVLLHCSKLGAEAYGIDRSSDALKIALSLLNGCQEALPGKVGLQLSDAQHLPFASESFDRVLMLDLVEHLYPSELERALQEAYRVLREQGYLIIHTMPNRWYYSFGYPIYRWVQRIRGERLPSDPRERWRFAGAVHVNEQDIFRLSRALTMARFRARVWLSTTRDFSDERNPFVRLLMNVSSRLFPLKLIFCNEIFALARKVPPNSQKGC